MTRKLCFALWNCIQLFFCVCVFFFKNKPSASRRRSAIESACETEQGEAFKLGDRRGKPRRVRMADESLPTTATVKETRPSNPLPLIAKIVEVVSDEINFFSIL